MASTPTTPEYLEFSVKGTIGVVTGALHSLKKGDTVGVRVPWETVILLRNLRVKICSSSGEDLVFLLFVPSQIIFFMIETGLHSRI